MIYLFAGDDSPKKIIAYEKFLKSAPKGTDIFKVGRKDFNQDQVTGFYSGSGLFSKKSLLVFSNLLEYEETREFLLEKLPLMGEAENLFIFLEGKLSKPLLDAFKKARAEMNVFEATKEKTEKFNNFLLADAFSARDKFNLWAYFRRAMENGVELEPLAGVLFWKMKDMLLKKNFSKFSEAEIKKSIEKLSYLLPEARTEGADAEAAFERFLLEAF